MKTPLFTGVCTALVTPFTDNKINYPMLKVILRRQIEANVKAIVIAGTTGEAPTLTDREKIDLFRISKEFVGDKCKIIAGTGTNSTEHTVALSKTAEDVGVDALLVVAPYYNKPNNSGLLAHFQAVSDAVDTPVILYNIPSRTGIDIPVPVYEALSKTSNIVGVKEASSDITKHSQIRAVCRPDFCIWAGNDTQIIPSASLGGSGVISVLSNILPEETVAMTDAALNGDLEVARKIEQQLLPLIELLFEDTNPIPVKEIMRYIGYDCGSCRLPLTKAASKLTKKICSII